MRHTVHPSTATPLSPKLLRTPTPLCSFLPPPSRPRSGPKESAALAADVAAAGGTYVEAPVLGSQPEAEKGTLLVMVGAEADPRAVAEQTVRRALGTEVRGAGLPHGLLGA